MGSKIDLKISAHSPAVVRMYVSSLSTYLLTSLSMQDKGIAVATWLRKQFDLIIDRKINSPRDVA